MYDIPKKILVDHDPQFRETFKKWRREEDIEVKYTPKKYPQAKDKLNEISRILRRNFSYLRMYLIII